MKKQKVFDDCCKLYKEIQKLNYHKPFIVCDEIACNSNFVTSIKNIFPETYFFSNYSSNPKYEEVVYGLTLFKQENCDFLISVGGGSSIDVAKTIKAFLPLKDNNYLEQKLINNDLFFIAVPTTAGTGSESTHFAVIYYQGKKYSIAHQCLIPNYVLLEPSFLESLPMYQKASTMLDAFCQGIESYWSVNANEESKIYAQKAIKLILNNYENYLKEDKKTYLNMLKAANYSGKAINISKTTAAHAMSYKITSLYGISHGHAVAVILPHLFQYMVDYINDNKRSTTEVAQKFDEIYNIFGVKTFNDVMKKIEKLYISTGLNFKHIIKESDLDILTNSVNEERLKNNPIKLSKEVIAEIYKNLL